MMMFDTRFKMFDDYESQIAKGENFVIDGSGMTFRHFLNVASNVNTVRLYMKYLQDIAPFIIKNLHFVNCSSIVDRMFSLVTPFLKKEVIEVMRFHRAGLSSLHEMIPKDCLPEEYGGNLGPIGKLHLTFCELVTNHRFVMDKNISVAVSDFDFVSFSSDYLKTDANWNIFDHSD